MTRFPARRLERTLLVLIALLVAWSPPARADGLAALVTDARGKVEIQRPGQAWGPASVMTQAPTGSQLRVAAGGQAALAFVQGGLKVRLSGPVTVRIEAGAASIVSGAAANVVSSKPSAKSAVTVPGGVNINKMGGVLSRGGAEVILLTGPAVLTPTPTISWRVGDDLRGAAVSFDQYSVRINDASGATVLKETLTESARELKVPPATLKVGQRYSLRLRGVPKDAGDSSQVTRDLVVLDDATVATLKKAQAEADESYARNPRDVSPLVILTWMYLGRDAQGDALPLAERILKARPDAKDAQILLYRLYMSLGDTAKAIELLKRTGLVISE